MFGRNSDDALQARIDDLEVQVASLRAVVRDAIDPSDNPRHCVNPDMERR